MTTPETPKSTPTTADDLFDFPCDFPIKVMGKTHPEFQDTIVTVIREYDGEFDVTRIETAAVVRRQLHGPDDHGARAKPSPSRRHLSRAHRPPDGQDSALSSATGASHAQGVHS